MNWFKCLVAFTTSLILSISSLAVFSPSAHAATTTLYWCSATDSTFNIATNWNTNADCSSGTQRVPTDGDVLEFVSTGLTADNIASNDMTLALSGINFSGTNTTYFNAIGGNAITLDGDIIDSSNGGGEILTDITLGADVAFSSATTNTLLVLQIGNPDGTSALNLATHNLGLSGAGSISIDANISGSGTITKSGAGQLYISGNNNALTGAVTVNGGSLWITSANAVGTNSAPGATINSGADFTLVGCGNLTFNGNLTLTGNSTLTTGDFPTPKLGSNLSSCSGGGGLTDETYGSVTSNVTSTFAGSISLGSDVTFAGSNATTNITGPLNGAYKLTMLPGYGGTLVVNSSSNTSNMANGTYTSPTFTKTLSDDQSTKTVSIGANNVITIDGKRSTVFVVAGGKLMGTGTVGLLNVASGATVAPGHSPGCLNTGNLVLNGALDEELGGTTACSEYDQLKVTGTVDVTNGTLNTILYNGFKPAKGQTFTIIDNDSNDAVTGAFTNLAEGATFTVSGYVFKITYKGGDGNDVVLSVQSVPATPNTGFQLFTDNPFALLAEMTTLAGTIVLIGRRYGKLTAK